MKTQTTNRTISRRHGNTASGFSLVEMTTVVVILILLIAIIYPTVKKALNVAKIRQTESTIGMISAACQQYQSDFDDFPPSDKDDVNMGATIEEGKQIVVVLLTGYPDDGDGSTSAEPDQSDLHADDGKTGFGFRTVKRGRVYGPYNGAENIKVGGDSPAFQDAFENDILYYRYGVAYTEGDNSTPHPSQDYLDACATVRTDFLIISPGPDGEFFGNGPDDDNKFSSAAGAPSDIDQIRESDDITNLD